MAMPSSGQKNQTISLGSNIIGVGFGAGHSFHNLSGFGPAFRLNYDHGTFRAGRGIITLGGTVGYTFNNYSYKISDVMYNENWTSFGIGIRAAWHYSWRIKNFDTYAGVTSGIRFDSFEPLNIVLPKPMFHKPNIYYGGFVGLSYYFNKHLGVFVEGGYDLSTATLGVNFKF